MLSFVNKSFNVFQCWKKAKIIILRLFISLHKLFQSDNEYFGVIEAMTGEDLDFIKM